MFTSTGITTGTPLTGGCGITLTDSALSHNLINFNNQMNNQKQQVKVAVFKVTRDEFGNIESSKFLEELWIEQTPGKSIDFAVARELKESANADEIVIKQITTVIL